MKEDTLKRLLSLIEKTGDRLVITDPSGEQAYVLMGLDQYEKLVVGEWKPELQKREPAPPQTLPISTIPPDNKPPARLPSEEPASKPPRKDIPLWKSPAGSVNGPRLAQDRPREEPLPSGPQPIPPRPASSNPHDIPLEPDGMNPEFEEERFYLEPVE